MTPLRIGTRGSALALWQARNIQEALRGKARAACEIVVIKTSGDAFQQGNVSAIGAKGVFIKELEDALLDRRVDLAVHSMKDVPTEMPAGLRIAAITERADPRDALVSRDGHRLKELPRGARVGTSSLRRRSQLLHFRSDLRAADLRGNVDTRLEKLRRGDYDAVVLAKAGLDRLGFSERITEILPAEIMVSAAGQGALGIEIRANDPETQQAVAALDDAATRGAVEAERAALDALGGGCQVSVGAWARVEGGRLVLDVAVLSPDGAECIRDRAAGAPENPAKLGLGLARTLLGRGAARLLARNAAAGPVAESDRTMKA